MVTYYSQDSELFHHGILGQKWGRRRFQNSDGTLTAEGKLRYKQDSRGRLVKLPKTERAEAQKKAQTSPKKKKEKSIHEMTNKELEKYIDRMQKEKTAYELRNTVNKLNPKPVSKGEQLVNTLMKDVVSPMLRDAGKQFLQDAMKSANQSQQGNKQNNKPKEVDKYKQAEKDKNYWKNLKETEDYKKQYYKSIGQN